jgi:hypothetical protein
VVEERLEAIPILTSKFGSIGYTLRRRRGIVGLRGGPKRAPWCPWSSISRRGVGGEIPLPSFFRPRTFRSEAAAYINNRWEVVIRYGTLALSGQPMTTQHWGPGLIAPDHCVPSYTIMRQVASTCMIVRVYSKTLVLWPTTRNARAGSQSTIHPKPYRALAGPRNLSNTCPLQGGS